MPRLDLVDSHLLRATRGAEPYVSFDAAWKAFNVLYEAEHVDDGRGNKESDLIKRAVQRLAPQSARLLGHPSLGAFVALDPVFDEKVWERSRVKDKSKHNSVRKRLVRLEEGGSNADHLQVLVDSLYVVRCNLAHGFKTPDGPRDQEVLAAAAPVLCAIVSALRELWREVQLPSPS